MIVRLLKLFLAPVIGISGIVIFFIIFLTPAQRGVIIKELMSRLPLARNFVTKTYQTHVYGLDFKDASDLKTATLAVDQLVLLEKKDKDGKTGKYYAVYPYIVEAGFELSQVKVEDSENKLRLIMPPVKVFNVDVNQKKGITVIRDSLEGHYEETLQPVKVGYHRFVHDLALQSSSNLLEKAEQSATEYFQTFWKGVYEKVEVVHSPYINLFLTVDMQHIPFQIRYNKKFKKHFNFNGEMNFDWYDTIIKTESGNTFFGFSQEFDGSYRNLSDNFKKNIDVDSILINNFHPFNPREGNWLGRIEGNHFIGFKLWNGNLYYIFAYSNDAEQAKIAFAEGIYLFSSAVYNPEKKLDLKYKEYVQLLYEARIAAEQEKLSSLMAISKKMMKLDGTSALSKFVAATTASLSEKTFHPTGNDKLDIYLKAWFSTQEGSPLDKETRSELLKLMKNENAVYYQYVYANSKKFNLDKQEKQEARAYLIDNAEISRDIIESLDGGGLKRLFENWMRNKVRSFKEQYPDLEKGFWGRALFSDLDAKNMYHWDVTGYPFFDKQALKNIHAKDKDRVYRLIFNCLKSKNIDPRDFFVLVISREKIFSDEYDAFLFGSDGFCLIKDIEDKPETGFVEYKNINLGSNEITLFGETYKNASLFYFLDTLHSSFRRAKGENVNDMFEKKMKERIYDSLLRRCWSPYLSA